MPLQMTSKYIKILAQDELMTAMQTAFDNMVPLEKADSENFVDIETLQNEMSKQMARIERLFGYNANSWTRGS